MKKLFSALSLTAFIFTQSAFAVSPMSGDSLFDALASKEAMNHRANCRDCAQPPTDRFAALEQMYAAGSLPSAQDLIGWHSGRCFSTTNRTVATGGLFAAWMESTPNDGPLFPGQPALKFGLYVYLGKSSDFFDSMTPTLRSEIQRELSNGGKSIPLACEKDGAMTSGVNSTVWQVRKSQGFLVAKHIEGTQLMEYCYYFKRVD